MHIKTLHDGGGIKGSSAATSTGAGIGASHQTGCTGLVAKLIQMYGFITSDQILEVPRGSGAVYQKEK